jgi:DnaJ-class molecular chaperone
MNFPDHYLTLGLHRKCTAEQIRIAYRVLAKKLHPDRNLQSNEATGHLQELNAAHEVLSDPEKRRHYDVEIADEEKSTTSTQRTGRIERNIVQDTNLSVEDFFRGVSLEVRVNDPANPHGAEVLSLEVPPDTAPGTRFRLPREEPFAGGFVTVRVKALSGHRFKVKGSDLQCDLHISAQRAAQGGTETVTGALGVPVEVEIPERVGRGAIVKIAEEGLPTSRGGRGDLLVRISYRPEVKVVRR